MHKVTFQRRSGGLGALRSYPPLSSVRAGLLCRIAVRCRQCDAGAFVVAALVICSNRLPP